MGPLLLEWEVQELQWHEELAKENQLLVTHFDTNSRHLLMFYRQQTHGEISKPGDQAKMNKRGMQCPRGLKLCVPIPRAGRGHLRIGLLREIELLRMVGSQG